MCQFILASFSADTELAALTKAIPEQLRCSLLRNGLSDSWPDHTHFEFQAVNSGVTLPCADEQLVTCTRVHCDCWSTLTTDQPDRNELLSWSLIFDAIHRVVPRFGFMIHLGAPADAFFLSGPVSLAAPELVSMRGIKVDTYYDVRR